MMEICPCCHAGVLRRRAVTYADWHTVEDVGTEQFIIIPRVPAWLCDVCGLKLFDEHVMARLKPLLGPVEGSRQAASQRFQSMFR
jgi:YgiT-type zinc finger domain-containing protein